MTGIHSASHHSGAHQATPVVQGSSNPVLLVPTPDWEHSGVGRGRPYVGNDPYTLDVFGSGPGLSELITRRDPCSRPSLEWDRRRLGNL